MKTESIGIGVSESIGTVSGALRMEPGFSFLFVFAHGAGAGMQHHFMEKLSDALAEVKIGTLRFNFPYMEKGGKRPDPAAIAEKTVLKAIEVAHHRYPGVPLLAGGKSFGGRMTSQALSKTRHPAVAGIVFAGFPLHAAGRPSTDRAAHLSEVNLPMLFLQGTRDALADNALVDQVCSALHQAKLVRFEGADHSFKAGKRDNIASLAAAVKAWTSGLKGAEVSHT